LKQDYFIVVLAHSFHGRLRRLHVPHRFLYGTFGVLGFALLCLFGVAGSYARMALKVSNYNSLQRETELLRHRYDSLQKQVQQTNQQLASLQVLATEVSAAYGIRNQIAGSPDLIGESPLIPSMGDSLAEYNYLRTTNLTRPGRTIMSRADLNVLPGTWPVTGPLMAGFGQRMDPFSGESAHHSGLDISAPTGTPVKAAADGVVVSAGWNGGYGRCVIIDHGNGFQTWYGHLSKIDVMEGEEIRQGEILGKVGMTGRATGPHLHYEVRIHATPVNPYRFLSHAAPGLSASALSAAPALSITPASPF
jgi:murein DD-endopeptidase MepM/ murein hydrolase activator NlpD